MFTKIFHHEDYFLHYLAAWSLKFNANCENCNDWQGLKINILTFIPTWNGKNDFNIFSFIHTYVHCTVQGNQNTCRNIFNRLGSRSGVNETSQISERYSDQVGAVMKQKSWLMLGQMYLSKVEYSKNDWHASFGHKRLCYRRATAGTFILNLLYTEKNVA